jgi:hypothetical protein
MLRRIFLFLTLVAIISVLGCKVTDDPVSSNGDKDYISAVLDKEFRLEMGQTGFVESENIKIKFLEVTGDSRCPSDVICVWAGEVKVLINIQLDDQDLGDSTLVGQAVNDDQAAKVFDGYSVRLLAVDPYPIKNETIQPSDYIITLIVTVAQ